MRAHVRAKLALQMFLMFCLTISWLAAAQQDDDPLGRLLVTDGENGFAPDH